MPECAYCEKSIDDEADYVRHLASAHEGELGRIDQRRVEGLRDTERTGLPTTKIAIGIVLLGIVAVVGAMLFVGGDDGTAAGEPTYDPNVHFHGTMEADIAGKSLDFSGDAAFIDNDQVFHFHGGEAAQYGAHIWHVHGHDVNLQWALESLGIEVNDAGTVLTYQGETYDDEVAGTSVEVTVNGETVEPATYELAGVGPMEEAAAGAGDDVAIVVTAA